MLSAAIKATQPIGGLWADVIFFPGYGCRLIDLLAVLGVLVCADYQKNYKFSGFITKTSGEYVIGHIYSGR